jgi:lysophospholipase L1-like esterase
MLKTLLSIFCFIAISYAQTITIIGDSITYSIKNELQQKYKQNIYIDAKVGRQFKEAVNIIKKLDVNNKLGDIVIIELGTNGDFNINDAIYIINYLQQKHKTIAFVNIRTNRNWQNAVNYKFNLLKHKYNNIDIIDWYTYSKEYCDAKNINCLAKDKTHLNTYGKKVYANMLIQYINKKSN